MLPDLYILYLRLLDAYDAGAQSKEIAAVLFSNIEDDYLALAAKLRDCRAAAETLRDYGYRQLAALGK